HFSGHGYGHGVGMCVIGSVKMAADGRSATEILSKYFPGLPIAAIDGRALIVDAASSRPAGGRAASFAMASNLAIALPDADERDRAAIARLAARSRDDLAQQIGIQTPPPITLRFYPTTDAYERATGQAWFTSGAVVRGELHLLPLAVLRERDILERTIRH